MLTCPPPRFPLTEGTYWLYQGLVRFDKPGSQSGGESKVTWRTEIVRVFHRDDALLAIVKGFPGDLNWSTGGAPPAEAMIVRTSALANHRYFSLIFTVLSNSSFTSRILS